VRVLSKTYLIREHRSSRVSSTGIHGSSSGAELILGDGQLCDGSVASLASFVGNDGDLGLVKISKEIVWLGIILCLFPFLTDMQCKLGRISNKNNSESDKKIWFQILNSMSNLMFELKFDQIHPSNFTQKSRSLTNLVVFHQNLAQKCQKLKVLGYKYFNEVWNWSKMTLFWLKTTLIVQKICQIKVKYLLNSAFNWSNLIDIAHGIWIRPKSTIEFVIWDLNEIDWNRPNWMQRLFLSFQCQFAHWNCVHLVILCKQIQQT